MKKIFFFLSIILITLITYSVSYSKNSLFFNNIHRVLDSFNLPIKSFSVFTLEYENIINGENKYKFYISEDHNNEINGDIVYIYNPISNSDNLVIYKKADLIQIPIIYLENIQNRRILKQYFKKYTTSDTDDTIENYLSNVKLQNLLNIIYIILFILFLYFLVSNDKYINNKNLLLKIFLFFISTIVFLSLISLKDINSIDINYIFDWINIVNDNASHLLGLMHFLFFSYISIWFSYFLYVTSERFVHKKHYIKILSIILLIIILFDYTQKNPNKNNDIVSVGINKELNDTSKVFLVNDTDHEVIALKNSSLFYRINFSKPNIYHSLNLLLSCNEILKNNSLISLEYYPDNSNTSTKYLLLEPLYCNKKLQKYEIPLSINSNELNGYFKINFEDFDNFKIINLYLSKKSL